MSANIFRQLATVNSFVNGDMIDSFRKEAYDVLNAFVQDAPFASYRKKDLLIKTGLMSEEVASKTLRVSTVSVRKFRSRFTSECFAIVGSDACQKIMTGSKKDCKALVQTIELYKENYSSDNLFPAELLHTLSKGVLVDDAIFDISDCKVEMTMLHWLSVNKYEQLLSLVDVDKMNYLLRVLDGKTGSAQDRLNLLKVLLCDNPLKHCRAEDRKYFKFPPSEGNSDD